MNNPFIVCRYNAVIIFLTILQCFSSFHYKYFPPKADSILDRRFFKSPGISASDQKLYCGFAHTLAIKPDNTLWAWGNNNQGQLGIGSTIQQIVPVQISSLSGITDAAGGYEHSVALKSNGTVWSWGRNV